MKKLIARIFRRLYPMRMQTPPLPPKAVVIGAPHTSVMDAVLMVMAFWYAGRPLRFMVKNQAADLPVLGALVRALGGVSIERSQHHGVVEQAIEEAAAADEFLLVIAPKGTRAQRPYWKSGFYHIALGAHIPVIYGFIDASQKVYGWDSTPHMLTGDMKHDMDDIRAFYAGKLGVHPELTSEPRLKGEEQ
ncbi:MAG: 1-acyl-sn-glycerol-3-phosphate acyltransferase [Arcanobacterium sp.]|nr:1-acyl-sn-glycerol-3-phosphate acyltransferase [Arcanobacterium sp.]MDY5589889.1 1-acyl-sn-glycerol-3-phosphate acyltransferase [Arcanobacterium sp.]